MKAIILTLFALACANPFLRQLTDVAVTQASFGDTTCVTTFAATFAFSIGIISCGGVSTGTPAVGSCKLKSVADTATENPVSFSEVAKQTNAISVCSCSWTLNKCKPNNRLHWW